MAALTLLPTSILTDTAVTVTSTSFDTTDSLTSDGISLSLPLTSELSSIISTPETTSILISIPSALPTTAAGPTTKSLDPTGTSSPAIPLPTTNSLGSPSTSSPSSSLLTSVTSILTQSLSATNSATITPRSSSESTARSTSASADPTSLPRHGPKSPDHRGLYIAIASVAGAALLLIIMVLAVRIVSRRRAAARLNPNPYRTVLPRLRLEKSTPSVYELSDFASPAEPDCTDTPRQAKAKHGQRTINNVMRDMISGRSREDRPSSAFNAAEQPLHSGNMEASQPQINPFAGGRNSFMAIRMLSVQHEDGGICLDRGADLTIDLPPVYRSYH